MFTTLINIISAIASFPRETIREAEEAYLNGATDHYDLEFRQRQVDMGMFRQMTS